MCILIRTRTYQEHFERGDRKLDSKHYSIDLTDSFIERNSLQFLPKSSLCGTPLAHAQTTRPSPIIKKKKFNILVIAGFSSMGGWGGTPTNTI